MGGAHTGGRTHIALKASSEPACPNQTAHNQTQFGALHSRLRLDEMHSARSAARSVRWARKHPLQSWRSPFALGSLSRSRMYLSPTTHTPVAPVTTHTSDDDAQVGPQGSHGLMRGASPGARVPPTPRTARSFAPLTLRRRAGAAIPPPPRPSQCAACCRRTGASGPGGSAAPRPPRRPSCVERRPPRPMGPRDTRRA